ncbi:MAG: TlpA family protein disulfide reductase [Gammaproteobacteria bacterium]|nr:TlpA family protein disulfide reductase [Gammaproteobacteria bacterium]
MRRLFKVLGIVVMLVFAVTATAEERFDDFQGNQQSIADFAGKGKWLVVMLWASDCQVCNQEAHHYIKFHQDHRDKDAQMLGISLDGVANKSEAMDFLKRHNVPFSNLIGEPEKVASMYQELTGDSWVGTPSFMVYTPRGELLGAQAGAVPVSIIESFIERESSTAQPKS